MPIGYSIGMRLPTLALTSLGSLAAAVLGGVAADPKGPAYAGLRKPAWQPPGQVFGPVWTALYADIAATTATALDRLDAQSRTRLWTAWGINLALNAAWPAVFFAGRRLWPAAALAGVLAISSADLARRVGSVSRPAGVLLAAYPAWCTFATALSTEIARRNS
jgi:tryptophan-rich sensory protein